MPLGLRWTFSEKVDPFSRFPDPAPLPVRKLQILWKNPGAVLRLHLPLQLLKLSLPLS